MVPKIFTPEEATRTLPYVKQVVAEIQEVFQQIQLKTNDEEEYSRLEKRLHELVRELESVGAYLKDASSGLVDFYGTRGEEFVWLCWKVGEETINHWHGLTEGYMKRQLIVEWPDSKSKLNPSSPSAP